MNFKAGDVFSLPRRFEIDDHMETEVLKGIALNEELFVVADKEGLSVFDFKTLFETKDLGENYLEIQFFRNKSLSIELLSELKGKNVLEFLLYLAKSR